MELLGTDPGDTVTVAVPRDNVAVAFPPRCAGYFSQHGLQLSPRLIEAVVQRDRIEHETATAHLSQQPYRASWPAAGLLFHGRAHGVGERDAGIAVIIAAAESHSTERPSGPQARQVENTIDLVQIQIHHGQAIQKPVPNRCPAMVQHRARVQAAAES